jgi:adenylate cyclase
LAAERVERKLAAILTIDAAGYSRLMEADEEGTHNALKQLRCEIIDPKIDAHYGRVVKSIGDGLLVEFGSVVDAVRCAVALQLEMVERNSEVSIQPPKRTYAKRTHYFARNELSRLCNPKRRPPTRA